MPVEPQQSNPSRRGWLGMLLVLLLLAVLLGLWLLQRTIPSSEPDATPPSPPPVATNVVPPEAGREPAVPIGEQILAQYLAPGGTVEEDLTWMSRLLENVRILVKGENPLPLGSNEEIAAALMGKNARREVYVGRTHRAINAKGQIIDRWGTPLFFHAQSADRIEIRSAGPDHEMWTADDVQRNANGTYSRGVPKPGTTGN